MWIEIEAKIITPIIRVKTDETQPEKYVLFLSAVPQCNMQLPMPTKAIPKTKTHDHAKPKVKNQ
jgi:hypothetical protein